MIKIAGLFIVVVGLIMYWLLGADLQEPVGQVPVIEADENSDAEEKARAAEQHALKVEKMTEKFNEVKESRKQLKKRISRLGSRLRRVEFSAEEAKTISADMRKANYLLKNPKLLGAFADEDDIQKELDRLQRTHLRMDEIQARLDEIRKANKQNSE